MGKLILGAHSGEKNFWGSKAQKNIYIYITVEGQKSRLKQYFNLVSFARLFNYLEFLNQ